VPGRLALLVPGRIAKFVAKPTSDLFPLPDAANDPTINGGSFAIFDTAAANTNTYALPASGWQGLGSPPGSTGFKYRGAGSAGDPCKIVLVKSKVVKALCRGTSITLTPPFVGETGVILSIGTDTDTKRYCASFGGTTSRNDSTLLKRKDAPPPGACPTPGP
jgi:hypothetical protein